MEFEHASFLQSIEDTRHIQTTVADLLGQALHEDMEGLGACGIKGVLEKEAHDTLTERLRTASPLPLDEFLRLGGVVVDEVQTEHKKVFGEAHHLLFVESEEVHIGQGVVVAGEALMIAEDALLLENIRRGHLLSNHITVVVAEALDLQGAVNEEIEMGAGVTGMDDLTTSGYLHKTKARMACHNLQIVAAHALKQRKLEESVVYLQGSHYSSILSCKEGARRYFSRSHFISRPS